MNTAATPSEEVLDSALLLRPARVANAYEETVQRLLQSIRLGLVGPGQRLPPERELATMLQVSRDTLRDAIGSLSENGWVIAKRGRYGGTFVSETFPTPVSDGSAVAAEDLEGLLSERAVLEVGVSRRAATIDHSVSSQERLWTAYENCHTADPGSYRLYDSRFHLVVAELVGSEVVTRHIADVRVRINELLDRMPLLPPNITHSDAQHRALIGAILNQEPDTASAVMAEHLEGTEALLRGFFA